MGLYTKTENFLGTFAKKARSFSYADYKAWEHKEGELFELIYGKTFAKAGANKRHQAILLELSSQFRNVLYGKPCKVYPVSFGVRLFYKGDESDDTVVKPDICIVCDEKKQGQEDCLGAPDMVVEVLSPSDTAIEMERKFRLYQKAGVREYWVIDPENNGLIVYIFKKDGISINSFDNRKAVPMGILPGISVNLEAVFAE